MNPVAKNYKHVCRESDVSVILITRNRHSALLRAVVSIKRQNLTPELIVVDNGSTTDVSNSVRTIFPAARIIRLPENRGVAGGRNVGIRAASKNILVFMDDDAEMASPCALFQIRQYFKIEPTLGILSLRSFLPDSVTPERVSIPRRDKRLFEQDIETSYFCGVGFAVRRRALTAADFFFEGFFYSCEELDLAWRVMDHGFKLIHTTQIRVMHYRKDNADRFSKKLFYDAKNRVWLAMRHLPWPCVASYAISWWGFLMLQAMRHGLIKIWVRGLWASFAGFPSVLRTRKKLKPETLKKIHQLNGRLFN